MPININNIISSETLARDFGRNSSIYKFFIEKSRVLWMKVKNNENIMKKYKSWKDSIRNVYGVYPGEELFFTHTYLSIITKLILFFILEENTSVSDEEITSVINGSYFRSHGILNFTDEDFSTWLLDNRIINDSLELIRQLAQRLSNYEYNNVKEDIFKEIYEELIERGERRKAGEYYTPEWLAQLVILEVMDLWLERRSYPPLIMDPACGSGTFLYNAIRILIERFPSISLNEILGRVIGIDINPIAAMIAKANYIIALKDLIKKGVSISIPVYRGDALKQHVKVNADVIVGNPPWVVLRNIKDESYQDYLKREVLRYGLISREDVHLYTQIELAALFFYKCSDVCLKDNGIIGFVMPRSVIGGTVHHVNFRRFRNPPMKLVKILDLENVYPLFNMPSCVLIAVKGGETRYPVLRVIYHGTLPKRNVSWEEARRFLR
ncbi:MAG: N-6 DNA methylase, partial [Desulfurococcales archaeon]|nr:N-6 DNA methylase [Desulfurococcales archaeon]